MAIWNDQARVMRTKPGPKSPDESYCIEFGILLRKHIMALGISQAEFARKIGQATDVRMGPDSLSTYINGKAFPSDPTLAAIAKVLGKKVEDILPDARKDLPKLQMTPVADRPDWMFLQINQEVPTLVAMEIGVLIAKANDKAKGNEDKTA